MKVRDLKEFLDNLTEEDLDKFIMIRYSGVTDDGDGYAATVPIDKILKKKNAIEIFAEKNFE